MIKIQFGWAVPVVPQPGAACEMAATLQFMSGGRFALGLGMGWKVDEYIAYGYDFPMASQRVEELSV